MNSDLNLSQQSQEMLVEKQQSISEILIKAFAEKSNLQKAQLQFKGNKIISNWWKWGNKEKNLEQNWMMMILLQFQKTFSNILLDDVAILMSYLLSCFSKDKLHIFSMKLFREYYPKGQQILRNIQQIQYLKWEQTVGSDNNFYWNVFWKGEKVGGGIQDQNGQKQGKWIELYENYNDLARVYFIGEYVDGKRIGNWLTLFDGKILCNGLFDENGLKTGNWVELLSNFSMFHILQYQFNQLQLNFLKRRILKRTKNKLMGYNLQLLKIVCILHEIVQLDSTMIKGLNKDPGLTQVENSYSILYVRLSSYRRIQEKGEYENGRRIGKWQIIINDELVGAKFYDQNGLQQGKQTELLQDLTKEFFIIQEGEYLDGKRVGQWLIVLEEKTIVGGGFYDTDGLKTGKWVEIQQKMNEIPINFEGEYIRGKRVGNWNLKQNQNSIGGGTFNEYGEKTGRFIELYKFTHQNFIWKGEYNNGRKCGNWQILFRGNAIGGGTYDENGLKDGKWIDMQEDFSEFNQIINVTEYKNGQIIRQLETQLWGKMIAGGFYDLDNHKTGKWIELGERYNGVSHVKNIGNYINGKKSGRWEIQYDNSIKGGGTYDEKNEKNGEWDELHSNFQSNKAIQTGNYQNGTKVGKWELKLNGQIIGGGQFDENGLKHSKWMDLHQTSSEYNQIFNVEQYQYGQQMGIYQRIHKRNVIENGQLNQNGLKHGKWMEQHEFYNEYQQIIFNGDYNNGSKTGKWEAVFKKQNIGGGVYDDNGLKDGFWIDLCQNFTDVRQVTFAGMYNHGKRIGKWDFIFKDNIIGGGQYLEFDTKQGYWIELDSFFQDDRQYLGLGNYEDGKKIGKWIKMKDQATLAQREYDLNGCQVK
ncbi:unnamed protein product [Paramecium octaurelia]|uniref:Uncharacterized protein n=1 Tax=Paramecium octaurelia TaxID=43137 RepID=A0A8S1TWX7_PAROT|nr:unnamed protein product [Paramecium octaurelia]